MNSLIVDLLVRSGIILGAAELLRRLPRQTASYRHRLLVFAFVGLAVWPLLAGVLPEWKIPLRSPWSPGYRITFEQTNLRFTSTQPIHQDRNWPLLIWLSGVLIAFTPILVGYRNLRRITRSASPITDPSWTGLLEELCRQSNLGRMPELLVVPAAIVPLTFGLLRRRILLPATSDEWSEARRRAVLLHELSHLHRHDLDSQLLVNIVAALWWFQPLCWVVRWNLRRESERACDALVLASGIRPSDYAAELLAMAHGFREGQTWTSPAISMARLGELEGRLITILNPHSRRALPKLAVLSLVLVAAMSVAASAITISSSDFKTSGGFVMKRTLLSGLLTSTGLSAATIAGSLFDPSGAAISNAKAEILNPDTSAKQQTTTTSDGTFTFGSLPAGVYILRVEKPGFSTLFREFTLQANSEVKKGLVLPLASAASDRPAASQPSEPKDIRIGPGVADSNLIEKVQPVYPQSAKQARMQGQVILQVVLSAEGTPIDISVVSSPSDDLTQSALDAVRQWRYRPVLLNGAPIQVTTTITVKYTLSE